MIKIELNNKTRKEIEALFLEDLFGSYNKQKEGKFVKVLNMESSRKLMKKDYAALYNYLYYENGDLKYDEVRKLLLADRTRMYELINELGSYNCENQNDRRLSDKLLSDIFRYDNFSERKVVYDILRKLGITVCPYCNRLYIMTLRSGKVRPQLDHFFPKSKYPYLALSLYNLIPSCNICNMAKSDMDTKTTPVLYPYEEEFGEKIVFTVNIDKEDKGEFVKYLRGVSDKFEVSIKNEEEILKYQVDNQNSRLHITDLYNEHKDYIKDIFKNFHINTDKRMEELLHTFPDIFSNKEEVRNLMYMNDIRKENWGKRPLAKLTYDIYTELEKWAAN